jgi:Zn finger protein HypA/HybF involved in hydrogenase expression
MYTSFVDGSLKQGFKEQIYEGNSDYNLHAEFGGDYTAKCKACNAIFQTQFVKIYQCPICGYSKNNNIE